MDDLLTLIETRRSVRKYKPEHLDDEVIGKMLDAFRWAPSEGNIQPWEVIIVQDPTAIRDLADSCMEQEWIISAPIIFAICINTRRTKNNFGERGEKLFSIQSTAAAIQNMLLMAHSLGVGTCWVSGFEDERIYNILDLPDWARPVALITAGIPDEEVDAPERHEISDFTYEEKFGREPNTHWKGVSGIVDKFRKEKWMP